MALEEEMTALFDELGDGEEKSPAFARAEAAVWRRYGHEQMAAILEEAAFEHEHPWLVRLVRLFDFLSMRGPFWQSPPQQ